MLGVVSVGSLGWTRSLATFLASVKERLSTNAALAVLLALNSIGYLYVQDWNRLLQSELQRQRTHIHRLYDEQTELILEKQLITAHKRLVVAGGRDQEAMHFPGFGEVVSLIEERS